MFYHNVRLGLGGRVWRGKATATARLTAPTPPTSTPPPGTMLLLLDDILVLVVDFLQTRILSQTCRRAWQLLRRRYVRYWVGQENIQKVAESLLQ